MPTPDPMPPSGWTDQLEREFQSIERDRHIRICYAGDVLNMPRLAEHAARGQFKMTLRQLVDRLEHGAGTAVGRRRFRLLVDVGETMVDRDQRCLGDVDESIYGDPPPARVFEDIHHLLVCEHLARLGWRLRCGRDITPSEAQRLDWDDLAGIFRIGSDYEENAAMLIPDPEDLREGLRQGRPELYEALVEAGTLDEILEDLHEQATAIAAEALAHGLAPDQAQEMAREAYRSLMEGKD